MSAVVSAASMDKLAVGVFDVLLVCLFSHQLTL
jgi:hypothetical protein